MSIVIPRLYDAHDMPRATSAAVETLRRRAHADRFLGLVLSDRHEAQWEYLVGLVEEGLDLDAIFLNVMAPTIRQIGVLWEEDRLSFVDVTTKSAHLQQLMRRLASELALATPRTTRRLLLAPVPGEQHTFGLFVLAEMFLRAGWATLVEPAATWEELHHDVSTQQFDAIGLSVGSERMLVGIGESVASLRAAALSADLRVFLGGWAFQATQEPLERYGADLVETDALAAIAKADILCPRRDCAVSGCRSIPEGLGIDSG
ncbi:B12-binding domain-containing protein [Aurantimonas sp. HBX-1]|uniref:cobalamin B12-binding domain-containing protein n=1 Tax=Aurantimonas sp. HBX-1 TaxID=2906072 RepID=UPI001F35FC0F|nr:cobalamin-dependent protein [Aurantimonas sp. HBX-1]UIJ73246.1 cobalamin B12-binding domain-containing protein [Aurantimonas sp. HBX-1]